MPRLPALLTVTALAACGPEATVQIPAPPCAPRLARAPLPCEHDAEQRARVAGLLAEGRLDRAVRVIERADRLCPAGAPRTREVLLATLGELGRAEPRARTPSIAHGRVVYLAGRSAREAGRKAEAQRLFDRALVELEAATGKRVELAVASELWSGARGVAWSKDGRLLAIAVGPAVSIRDASLGLRETARLEGHAGQVTALAFSPDGQILATSAPDGVRLWSVATASLSRGIESPRNTGAIAFSPDGRILAVVSESKVRLWDTGSGAATRDLLGPGAGLRDIAFSPDGKTLASGTHEPVVLLWDVATGAEARRLGGFTEPATSVAFSPDGKVLATGSWDNTVRLWDVATGNETRRLAMGKGAAIGVAFSPDGTTFATGSEEDYPGTIHVHHPVRLWDLATATVTRELEQTQVASAFSMAFSPDGKTLASADVHVHVWDVATGVETRTLGSDTSKVRAIAFSPHGKTLASGMDDGTVRLWRADPGAGMRVARGHTGGVSSLAFLPDGRTLVSGSFDDTLRLWEVETGAEERVLRGHTGGFFSVAASPDGRTLASGTRDHEVRLWDVATGVETLGLHGHTGTVNAVAFGHGGKTLVSASSDRTVRLWDVATGAERGKLDRAPGGIACSPDGDTLATENDDHRAQLWNAATLAPIRALGMGESSLTALAFSPRSALLATASVDHAVHLLDAWSGVERHRLAGAAEQVTALAFSSASDVLAASSEDGAIRLWTAGGEALLVLRAGAGHDAGFAFTPGNPPQAELLGGEAELAADELTCRVGPLSFPFDLCRERALAPGLLAAALAGERPRDEP